MSRRMLLAGSASALLAGCGKEVLVAAAPADALRRQLAAEAALVAATGSLPEAAPRSAAGVVREVHARARARAERVAAAARAQGADPRTSLTGDDVVTRDEAVARGEAAIVAHVTALPSLAGRELRALGAELVTGAAADTALLGDALRMPVHDAFPGTPR